MVPPRRGCIGVLHRCGASVCVRAPLCRTPRRVRDTPDAIEGENSVQRDDVELADALVVASDVDGDDAVVAQCEPHDAANLTAGCPDERSDAVDDREARAARTTRQRVGDRLGAARLAERPY